MGGLSARGWSGIDQFDGDEANPLAPDGGRNSGWIQSPSADAPAASFVTCLPASDGRSRLAARHANLRMDTVHRRGVGTADRRRADLEHPDDRFMEYCLVAGIETLVVETHPKLVNLLVTTGWDVMPLAAPSVLDDALIVRSRPSVIGRAASSPRALRNQWKRPRPDAGARQSVRTAGVVAPHTSSKTPWTCSV